MKSIDIAIKDVIQSFRSVFMVGMTIIAPLVITGLMFLAFGGVKGGATDLPRLQLGIVNHDQGLQDQDSLGDLMVEMFTDPSVSSWLEVKLMQDEALARQEIDEQKLGALIVFPENLSSAAMAGEDQAEILIVQDPTITITPAVIRNMVVSFLDGVYSVRVAYEVIDERASETGLAVDAAALQSRFAGFSQWYIDFQRSLFHNPQAPLVMRSPEVSQAASENAIQRILSFTLVGQMIFFAFFTAAFAMQSILREDEEGTLQRLFTTPTVRTQIITGKFIAVFVTVALQSIVLLVIGRFLFGVSWGPFANVLVAVLAQVAASAGLGVLLISLVKTTRQAGPVLGGGLTVLGMLGGLFTVAIATPAGFAAINKLTPQGWVMDTWRIAISAGSIHDLLTPALVSIGFGVVTFAIGAILFRRRYA